MAGQGRGKRPQASHGGPPPGHGRVVIRETTMDVPYDQWAQVAPHATGRPAPPPWEGKDVAGAVLGNLLPLVTFFAVLTARNFMDNTDPSVGPAATWYIIAALLGLMGIVVAVLLCPERAAMRIGIAAAVGLPIGAWFAGMIESSYGPAGFVFFWWTPFGWMLFLVGFAAWLTSGILTLTLGNSRGGHVGADAALSGGMGLALANAGAAVYHLITLPHQEDLAREANNTPGLGVVVLLVAVAVLAWQKRQRIA